MSAIWSHGVHSGLVSIKTHSLFLSASGPDRDHNDLAIVVIPGLTSTIAEWPAVRRLVEPFARIYLYDRAGYGKSERSPNLPSSQIIAAELDQLLRAANIEPPYVLVCHSWGGILGRELYERRADDIVGIVLVDAADENSNAVLPFGDPDVDEIRRDVDYLEISGTAANHKLTPVEWEAFIAVKSAPGYADQAAKELAQLIPSEESLALKQELGRKAPLMGSKPLSVIASREARDFRNIYDAGVSRGNGTQKQREKVAKILEGIEEKAEEVQKEQLSLSSCARFLQAECGHSIHLLEPGVIAEEINWVLEKIKESQMRNDTNGVAHCNNSFIVS
ncbi:hypothetical protein MMC18_007460 [Xylographa bjoerkii]|nr:hypothetical protein [Xylographa bjoerkii]MCJ1394510.1 hypothetical protein [Xylographa bjoerkii]MCJ1394580.1 hypothetical protein [Xylographa bjoerkii]